MKNSKLSKQEITDFKSKLIEYDLEKIKSFIEPHIERCILLEISNIDEYDVCGNSRRCGWPDLPLGWEWPKDSEGRYLNFLCQINLKDISVFQEVLPKTGILYFFVGGIDLEPEGKILYFNGDVDNLRLMRLMEPLDVSQFSMGIRPDFDVAPEDFLLVHYPRKLNFYSALSIPDIESDILETSGNYLKEILSYNEIKRYQQLSYVLEFPVELRREPFNTFHCWSIHQRLFGYFYDQGLEPRIALGGANDPYEECVDLYSITDHDEVFQTALDGEIVFTVKQSDLINCQFNDILVSVVG